MGMDVYGKQFRSEKGKYFRANVWSWHPIADLCDEWFPELWGKIENPHTNDGDGLNADDSRILGKQLMAKIELGELDTYIKQQRQALDALPDEPCPYCDATGTRQWDDGPKKCNGCDGKGTKRPWITAYGMDHDHVKQWAEFLIDCGGFEIW